MHDRAYAIATGAFMTAALAALVLTAYWLTGADQEQRPYIVVSAYSVAGLSEGSEVLYRGVPAGRVEEIGIDPSNPAQVLIGIAVDDQIPVLQGTYARLHQRGLTGVAQVELAHGPSADAPLPTSAQDPARIPMVPSLLDEVTDAGTQALEILSELADSLSSALDADNGASLASIASRVNELLTSVEQVADTLEANLPRTLNNAAQAAESVSELAERTTASMDEVDLLIADLRETAAVAQRLGEQLSGTGVPGFDAALEGISRAAQDLARLARDIAREPERLLRGRQTAPGPGEE